MNNKYRYSLLFFLPLLLLLMGASALKDPKPVPIPDGLTKEKVAEAIKVVLLDRGWKMGKAAEHVVEAMLHIRTHMIKVKIEYSGSAVKISYLDSENMKFVEKSGVRFIHPNYNKWARTIGKDIRKNMVLLAD